MVGIGPRALTWGLLVWPEFETNFGSARLESCEMAEMRTNQGVPCDLFAISKLYLHFVPSCPCAASECSWNGAGMRFELEDRQRSARS